MTNLPIFRFCRIQKWVPADNGTLGTWSAGGFGLDDISSIYQLLHHPHLAQGLWSSWAPCCGWSALLLERIILIIILNYPKLSSSPWSMVILIIMIILNSILWAVGTPSHEYLSNRILCLHSRETFNSDKKQKNQKKRQDLWVQATLWELWQMRSLPPPFLSHLLYFPKLLQVPLDIRKETFIYFLKLLKIPK